MAQAPTASEGGPVPPLSPAVESPAVESPAVDLIADAGEQPRKPLYLWVHP